MPQLIKVGGIGQLGGTRGAGGSAASPFFNVTASNTQLLRDAIDGANAGTSRDKIMLIGDSTMWGAWSDNVDSTGLKTQSVPFYLSQALNTRSIAPAESDSWFGCGDKTTNAVMKKYNPCHTGSTSYIPGSSATAYALGGYMFRCASSGQALGYNTAQIGPAVTYNTIESLVANPASGGSLTISVSGVGNLVTITNNAGLADNTPRFISTPVGSDVTNAVLATTNAATPFNFMGQHIYNTASFKLAIMGAGIPGASSVQWNTDSTTFVFNAKAGLAALAPKFVFIELTINDARLGTAINTYKANIQALCDVVTGAGGGVCLVVGNQRYTGTDTNINNGTETSLALQQTYRQAYYDLATLNDFPLIDMWTAGMTWDALFALGYLATESGNPSAAHLLGTVAAPGNQGKAAVYADFCEEVAA